MYSLKFEYIFTKKYNKASIWSSFCDKGDVCWVWYLHVYVIQEIKLHQTSVYKFEYDLNGTGTK